MTQLVTDGHSLAHRVWHTTHQFDVNGEPCGLAVGFLRMMASLCTNLKEVHLEPLTKIVVFDHGRCFWRREAFKDYKANRGKPEVTDFLPQLDALQKALPFFGFHVLRSIGTEGDDLCGVASYELESRTNERIICASSDHDLWQLITDRVSIYDFQTKMTLDKVKAEEILGFPVTRLVEMKALAGDASDNIKGAKGIGQKGALEILAQESDLQALLTHLEEANAHGVKQDKALHRKLAASIEDVRLAGKLCTIAQTYEQLWTEEARVEVKKAVDWAIGIPAARVPLDDMVLEAYADLWRVRDADTWKYAFS